LDEVFCRRETVPYLGLMSDARPSRPEMPLERIMRIAEFRASLRTFLRQSERVSRQWGLTPRRYLLLLLIKGAPDGTARMSLTDLSERLKLSKNTVSELCNRAEEIGLIEREGSADDGRVVFFKLTAVGNRRLAGALADSDPYRREVLAGFESLLQTFRAASSS